MVMKNVDESNILIHFFLLLIGCNKLYITTIYKTLCLNFLIFINLQTNNKQILYEKHMIDNYII